ncbi:hypothetical protein DXG01_006623 [Tephrocybe rancida]|nr:hypothetical protein DXG01_006623 [Tephrocybe rancida]
MASSIALVALPLPTTHPSGMPPSSMVPTPLAILHDGREALRGSLDSLDDDEDEEDESRRRKNIMDMHERRRRLEADPWALEVMAKTVKCRGCNRWIKLDQRSMYYSGLWKKHRNLCRGVKQMKGEWIPKRTRRSKDPAKASKDASARRRSTKASGNGTRANVAQTAYSGGRRQSEAQLTQLPQFMYPATARGDATQGGYYSRESSVSLEQSTRGMHQFGRTVHHDTPPSFYAPFSSDSDDDADIMTPRSEYSTFDDLNDRSSYGAADPSAWNMDVDDDAADDRYTYEEASDRYSHRGSGYPPRNVAVVAKEKPFRYTPATTAGPGLRGGSGGPSDAEHHTAPTASRDNMPDRRISARTIAKPRQQVGLAGPGVPGGRFSRNGDVSGNTLPPISVGLTNYSSYDKSHSEYDSDFEDEVNMSPRGGVFAPVMRERCPDSPCGQRFRYSTQYELNTYFNKATIASMSRRARSPGAAPHDLSDAQCLLSLANSG